MTTQTYIERPGIKAMTEIKPKYVDGEPVCSEACIQFDSKNYPCVAHEEIRFCKIEKLCIQPGDPCIPGLRQQREQLKAKLAALSEDIFNGKNVWIVKQPQEQVK